MRLRAHAKLNLALRVGARRNDGYHPIAGVFQTISLCDLLYARRADGGSPGSVDLRVAGAELPAENTVTAAVGRLATEARARGVEPLPLRMELFKRVPMGAGLGGGSADAVAAMAACVRLWGLDRASVVESGCLRRVAAEVGSDVPFFLVGGTAMVTGRGERVEPLPELAATWFVVAAPRVHVSTPVAYAAYDAFAAAGARPGGARAPHEPSLPPYQPLMDEGWMGNDLQPPVSAEHPEIEAVRRRLVELGTGPVQMTGSGAAVFGACDARRGAMRVARTLRAEGRWAGAFVSVDGETHRRGLFDAHPAPVPGGGRGV